MSSIHGFRTFRRTIASVLLVPFLLSTGGIARGENVSISSVATSDEEFPCPPYLRSSYADSGTGFTFFGIATMTMAQNDEYGGRIYTYEFIGYTVDRHQKIKGIAHIAPEYCAMAYYAYLRGITVAIAQLHNTTLYEVACNTGPDPENEAADDPYAASYDPSSPTDDPEACSGPSGAGGSGEGSGTPYEPGDNTGGETVDWHTGEGNGGVSLCGGAATVEYICIDTWDGEKWVRWSCGFATTC